MTLVIIKCPTAVPTPGNRQRSVCLSAQLLYCPRPHLHQLWSVLMAHPLPSVHFVVVDALHCCRRAVQWGDCVVCVVVCFVQRSLTAAADLQGYLLSVMTFSSSSSSSSSPLLPILIASAIITIMLVVRSHCFISFHLTALPLHYSTTIIMIVLLRVDATVGAAAAGVRRATIN